ncbi:hypothetical protein [Glycomyces arizonensis]|uniref:hypothetical protein n=1 Tax=Glycomyces arizonensis TaxID=256035 RepID=UPI000424D87E|nr:hypothetical protein [Glycomyces arizonensis]
MSAPIVAHATVKTKPNPPRGAELERGSFADSVRTYTVRASSQTAPDSFQVHTGDARDIVLVISGLNTGELHATWGPGWRTASESWREWAEAQAFMVFYNGEQPSTANVRVCNG